MMRSRHPVLTAGLRQACALAVALIAVLLSAAPAAARPTAISSPTLDNGAGSASVSAFWMYQQILCRNGKWNESSEPFTYTYEWLRDGTPIPGATASRYLTQVEDIGTTLTCEVTATDQAGLQASTSSSMPVQASPIAILVRQFGEEVDVWGLPANTAVTIELHRDQEAAGTAKATADLNGRAGATPAPGQAVGYPTDTIRVHLPDGTVRSSVELLGNASGYYLRGGPTFGGHGIQLHHCNGCTRVLATITRASGVVESPVDLIRDPGGQGCPACYETEGALPGGPVGDADMVDFAVTRDHAAGHPGATRSVIHMRGSQRGFLDLPSCLANLQTAELECLNLPTSLGYELQRRREGHPGFAMKFAPGTRVRHVFADDGIRAGDWIDLYVAGVDRPVLTSLHVGRLRADVVAGGVGSGVGECEPGKRITSGSVDRVCPASGTFTPFATSLWIADDHSPGGATIAIPAPVPVAPLDGTSIARVFRAYAETKDRGKDPVRLRIATHATPTSFDVFTAQNTNRADGALVTIPEGRYVAEWQTRVAHVGDPQTVDTSTLLTRFVAQPATSGEPGPAGPQGDAGATGAPGVTGPAGPAGATGPAGAAGPAGRDGRDGRDARVACRPRGKRVTCRVQLVKTASMVRLRLERRGRVLARGSARVRAGRAELGLRSRGRLQAGSYELVLVYRTSGERPTIVRQPLRVAAG